MAELRECPFRRVVALCAVIAKQAPVPVFGLVARRAIKKRLLARELWRVRRCRALLRPGEKYIEFLMVRGSSVLGLP